MNSAVPPKSKFRNNSKGIVGVTKLDLEGKPQGVPVPYNGEVWLSEQEEILTANAPRNEKDNPFTNGSLELLVAADQVEHERPIGSKAARKPAEQTPESPAVPPAPPTGDEQPAVAPEDLTPAAAVAAPREAGASVVGTDEHQPQTRVKQAAAARQPTPEEIAAKDAEAKRQEEAAKAAAEAEAARQRQAAKAAADAQAAEAAKPKPGPLASGSPGNSADAGAAAQGAQPPAAAE